MPKHHFTKNSQRHDVQTETQAWLAQILEAAKNGAATLTAEGAYVSPALNCLARLIQAANISEQDAQSRLRSLFRALSVHHLRYSSSPLARDARRISRNSKHDYDAYLAKQAKNGEYGSDLEAQALAEIFGIELLVVNGYGKESGNHEYELYSPAGTITPLQMKLKCASLHWSLVGASAATQGGGDCLYNSFAQFAYGIAAKLELTTKSQHIPIEVQVDDARIGRKRSHAVVDGAGDKVAAVKKAKRVFSQTESSNHVSQNDTLSKSSAGSKAGQDSTNIIPAEFRKAVHYQIELATKFNFFKADKMDVDGGVGVAVAPQSAQARSAAVDPAIQAQIDSDKQLALELAQEEWEKAERDEAVSMVALP